MSTGTGEETTLAVLCNELACRISDCHLLYIKPVVITGAASGRVLPSALPFAVEEVQVMVVVVVVVMMMTTMMMCVDANNDNDRVIGVCRGSPTA